MTKMRLRWLLGLVVFLVAPCWASASVASSSHLVVTSSTRSSSASKLAGSFIKVHSLPSSALLLKLRGGSKNALFWTLPPDFMHSVVLSLLTNSLAILLCNEFVISKDCGLPLWRVYAHNMLVTFVIYIAIFFMSGFVPMGYVPGAKPFVKLFEP